MRVLVVALSLLGAPAALACSPAPANLVAMLPADGATDVPSDARLMVIWSDGEIDSPETYLLLDANDGEIALSDDFLRGADGRITVALRPEAALPAGAYRLQVLQRDNVKGEHAFEVGTRSEVALEGAPVAGEPTLEAVPEDSECVLAHHRAAVQVTPIADPDGLSVLLVFRDSVDSEPIARVPLDGSADPVELELELHGGDGEECLVFVQESASGLQSDPSEVVCADLAEPTEEDAPRGRGCSTVPAGGSLGLLGLVGLLARRRRG